MKAHAVNIQLLLWLQSYGLGKSAARHLVSTLGLSRHAKTFETFSKFEKEIGKKQIELSNIIISCNVHEEMKVSPANQKCGRKMLATTLDGGWTFRGGGNAYNSDIGHQIVIGARTQLVLALCVLMKVCALCRRKIEHTKVQCNINYTGSSKGMEATGAAHNVNSLFSNFNCYVQTVVMDNDSSTKNVLQHKYSQLQQIANQEGREYIWPKKDGRKLPNTGRLPPEHKQISFLADINHRLRGKSKAQFRLAYKPLKESICTKTDCYRMKRNQSLCIFLIERRDG